MSKDEPLFARLCFGDFVWDGYKLVETEPPERLYLVHPMGIIQVVSGLNGKIETPDLAPLKKMVFIYRHSLGRNYFQYDFEREEP